MSGRARAHLDVSIVRVTGAKMAKSTGNLVLVSDVLDRHSAAAVRLLILDRPWAEERVLTSLPPWRPRPGDWNCSR